MKKLCILFVLLLSVLFFAGCGEKKEGAKDEKITIKVEPVQPEQKQTPVSTEVEKRKEIVPPKKEAVTPKKPEHKKPKILTAEEIKERMKKEMAFLREKGFLPRDIPGLLEIIKDARSKIQEGKLEELNSQLDEAHKTVENFKVDKEFIDKKSRWVKNAIERAKSPETHQKVIELRNEAMNAYKKGDYNRANEYLTRIVEEVRQGLPKGFGKGYEPKMQKDYEPMGPQ